jgi:hypothetical protein
MLIYVSIHINKALDITKENSCEKDYYPKWKEIRSHDIRTLEELLKGIESNLEVNDIVYIYESKLKFEWDSIDTIESNIRNNVEYKILYYDDADVPLEEFEERVGKKIYYKLPSSYATEKGEMRDILDAKLSHNTNFGIIIYKKSKYTKGFFCVNFSEKDKNCGMEEWCGECKKVQVFYKTLDKDFINRFLTSFNDMWKTIVRGA